MLDFSPAGCYSIPATKYGGIPEWPKGADCKSVSSAFGGSNPPSPTKKEVTFVYQKLFLFLSKPQAWHIITARSAVHIICPFGAVSHHALACISSPQGVYHHQRCILLRLDDIPQQVADDMQNFVLMIYNGKPLICFLKCCIMRFFAWCVPYGTWCTLCAWYGLRPWCTPSARVWNASHHLSQRSCITYHYIII